MAYFPAQRGAPLSPLLPPPPPVDSGPPPFLPPFSGDPLPFSPFRPSSPFLSRITYERGSLSLIWVSLFPQGSFTVLIDNPFFRDMSPSLQDVRVWDLDPSPRHRTSPLWRGISSCKDLIASGIQMKLSDGHKCLFWKDKPRHPQWQKSDDIFENSESESPSDSLRDIQDISLNLKLSLDGEKAEENSTLDSTLDSEESTVKNDKLENAVLKLSKDVIGVTRKLSSNEKNEQNKFPMLRRRNCIFVVAVDCDSDDELIKIIQRILEVVRKASPSGSVGLILSTWRTISETHSALVSGGMLPTDFDAFICNSGSDIYYPSLNSEDAEPPFLVDLDYHSHIEYRWGGEGLRKTLVRWAATIVDKNGESEEQIVTEDEQGSSIYCHAFKVKNPERVPSVKELRKLMRIQALRCHVLYSHNGSKLHVIPVLASRSQALRYLYVRWGTELSNMVVFVGESGGTDYEGFLGGVHRTIILKGVCSPTQSDIHPQRSYSLEDVVAFDSPNILQTEAESATDGIEFALSKLGILSV
ncbi:hypothetical protein Taro_049349 [Colocasia esculenta]|uniref:Sucrose phosphatase-like domain-containing protein n=1 Tax=Colocasia esculenta TaxID=4460 RepID=A0A843XAP8_COLES|nr:hypothetical protein [Colocasia esculenta]